MKSPLSKLVLCFFATFPTLSAQEAWLLEMPHKYSDYLVKKSLAGDYDIVAGIVKKFPNLIAGNQVRELELIKWNAEDGKIHKKKKVTEGSRTFNAGSRYYSQSGESLDHRKVKITPSASTERNFEIDAMGQLSRAWTPTFIHKGEKLTVILLERHPESGTATVDLSHMRQLEFDAGATKELVAWHSSDSLDSKGLGYQSETALVANPKVKFGVNIFTTVSKDGDSLLRLEANSKDAKTPGNVILHHNEAKFKGHSETTGPLKMETIKVADKSFTAGEDQGAWTLTLKSGE